MSNLPPLTVLRSLRTVVQLSNISWAAGELHAAHSAISQQIRLLRNPLGLTLFIHERRDLYLNENGRFYTLRVRASLDEIVDAMRVVWARS